MSIMFDTLLNNHHCIARIHRLQRHYAEGRVTRARVLQSIKSWVAHALHADAAGLKRHILGRFKFLRASQPTTPKDPP